LERPDRPHSATNRFLYRYAYVVLPVGNTIDMNYIHNQAKNRGPRVEGYFRNQNVGTWEMSLASFLVDLNTNLWPGPQQRPTLLGTPYFYDTTLARASTGTAFDDATSIYSYRYAFNYRRTMLNVLGVLGAAGANAFSGDFVDDYTGGPLMTGTTW